MSSGQRTGSNPQQAFTQEVMDKLAATMKEEVDEILINQIIKRYGYSYYQYLEELINQETND